MNTFHTFSTSIHMTSLQVLEYIKFNTTPAPFYYRLLYTINVGN